MHNACLFPGLNTIARERDRQRYIGLPSVKKYLTRLAPLGYSQWLNRPAEELYESRDFTALSAIALAIQTGVFEDVCQRGFKPDLLIGCSLGDLSRTVCSGSIGFDDAIALIDKFQKVVGDLDIGRTYSVRLPPGQRMDNDLYDQLTSKGLQPSVLSNRHFIIGCDVSDERLIAFLAAKNQWQLTKSPFDFALHSRHLIPMVDKLKKQFVLSLKDPEIPVFSTYKLELIDSAEAMYEEAWYCFCTPMNWVNSLDYLKKHLNIERFVNIGPCLSLPLLLRESSLNIKMENANDIV